MGGFKGFVRVAGGGPLGDGFGADSPASDRHSTGCLPLVVPDHCPHPDGDHARSFNRNAGVSSFSGFLAGIVGGVGIVSEIRGDVFPVDDPGAHHLSPGVDEHHPKSGHYQKSGMEKNGSGIFHDRVVGGAVVAMICVETETFMLSRLNEESEKKISGLKK